MQRIVLSVGSGMILMMLIEYHDVGMILIGSERMSDEWLIRYYDQLMQVWWVRQFLITIQMYENTIKTCLYSYKRWIPLQCPFDFWIYIKF
jgi:hypothetical protein